MNKLLFNLRIKAFFRSPLFATNLVLTIVVALYAILLALLLFGFGLGTYFVLEEVNVEPFEAINRYLVYFFATDLTIRYIFQKFNANNIKSLLLTNFTKSKIVTNILIKSLFSIFNIFGLLYLLPLIVVFISKYGFSYSLLSWSVACVLLLFLNNYINLLLNKIDIFFYILFGLAIIAGLAQYYQFFQITDYTYYFYKSFYNFPFLIIAIVAALACVIYLAYKNYISNLFLDKGLQTKQTSVQNINLSWLDRFGITGAFLKLDIKMLLRNKRSKSAMLMSFVFVFYGFLFFTDFVPMYNQPIFHMFAAVFVTGGFVFNFGNYIPSWDSSYYPFMMTQTITYSDYLKSKWWLMVLSTLICSVLALFYLYFGIDVYLMILSGAIFNIGVNTHLVMLSGAFVKTPIDLATNKNLMGDKSAFNIKSVLLAMPKIFLPMFLYGLGVLIKDQTLGYIFVSLAGLLGFLFRNFIFKQIEKVYKLEKYSTIAAYKRSN